MNVFIIHFETEIRYLKIVLIMFNILSEFKFIINFMQDKIIFENFAIFIVVLFLSLSFYIYFVTFLLLQISSFQYFIL